MANINQNGITFNNYKTAGVPTNEWPFRLTDQQGPDEDGGIINAVDIDWNGANLSAGDAITTLPTALNTTGELLVHKLFISHLAKPSKARRKSRGWGKSFGVELLETESSIFNQEGNDTDIHDAVLIRPLLSIAIHNHNLPEEVTRIL